MLWNCARFSVYKALTIETTRKHFRIAHSYSISNSYSISKWHTVAACSLCQRLHTTRDAFHTPLCILTRTTRWVSGSSPVEAATSFFQCIKDPMFTRTWSSETTATHNASNNRDTRISSAHPRTFVTPTIHWERGVLCKLYKRTRLYEGEINLFKEKPMLFSLTVRSE